MREKIRSFLQENRWWIIISASVFCLGFLLGFVIVILFPQVLEFMLRIFQQVLKKEIETLQRQENWKAVWQIFIRNLKACLVFALGGLLIGIPTFSGLLFNGFILGVVCGGIILSGQIVVLLATVLPHAIFELPAIIFAGAWGFRLGTEWILDRSKGGRGKIFMSNFKKFIYFTPILIIMLLLAALIEVFVSGKLALGFT